MGWGQSKEQNNSNNVVSQTVNNNQFFEKLDTITWIIIALIIVISIVILHTTWNRCRSSIKGWVRKQTGLANSPNLSSVQTVPQQQAAPPATTYM